MKSEGQSGKDEILDRLPEWVKSVRKMCIELVKEHAPEEYIRLKKTGII